MWKPCVGVLCGLVMMSADTSVGAGHPSPLAQWIAAHDFLRVAAQGLLRPIVWWAQAALVSPLLGFLVAPVCLAAFRGAATVRFRRRPRRAEV